MFINIQGVVVMTGSTSGKEPPGIDSYENSFSDNSIGPYNPSYLGTENTIKNPGDSALENIKGESNLKGESNFGQKYSLEKTLKYSKTRGILKRILLPGISLLATVPMVYQAIKDNDSSTIYTIIPTVLTFICTTYNAFHKKSLFEVSARENLENIINSYGTDNSLTDMINKRFLSGNM